MQGRTLYLSKLKKSEYITKSSQLLPEVLEGERSQSTSSDKHAVGWVFYRIAESGHISTSIYRKILLKIAEKCQVVKYLQRLSGKEALLQIQDTILKIL